MKTTNHCLILALIIGSLMTGGAAWLFPPGTHAGVFLAIWLIGCGAAFKSATDIAAKRKTIESK